MTEKILLAHGSGGKLSADLVRELFLKEFDNDILSTLNDAAILTIENNSLAFTTDSYVVKPLFFPGGNIGKLSICGTVNDLAVMGTEPLFISCGFIIEEGLAYSTLQSVVKSMKKTADAAGVAIVTGDTKVVEKGSGDGLFINTAGIGSVDEKRSFSMKNIKAGDRIILNGNIAEHGLAVLGARGDFNFRTEIASDCAPLNNLISGLLEISPRVKFMRDPTRGGVAAVLNEMVQGKPWGILIDEEALPIREEVKSLTELLGFDPLYIANEGKVLVVVASEDAEKAVEYMHRQELGKDARIIGKVVNEMKGKVGLKTVVGGARIVDMPLGEQLPRIC